MWYKNADIYTTIQYLEPACSGNVVGIDLACSTVNYQRTTIWLGGSLLPHTKYEFIHLQGVVHYAVHESSGAGYKHPSKQ